jgi:hypothetical protein
MPRRRVSNPRIPRLDLLVNEIAALIVRQKSALHRIDSNFLKIV